MENLRSGTCAAPNAAVEKGLSCDNDPAAKPVGSTVDKVTVKPYNGEGQALAVTVPNAAPGRVRLDHRRLQRPGQPRHRRGEERRPLEAAGSINPIVVSDNRRHRSPWSISASVSDFADAGKTFSGSYLGWAPKVVEAGAGAKAGNPVVVRVRRQRPGSREVARPRLGRPGSPGRASPSSAPTWTLKIPGDVENGGYRATLTITALSSKRARRPQGRPRPALESRPHTNRVGGRLRASTPSSAKDSGGMRLFRHRPGPALRLRDHRAPGRLPALAADGDVAWTVRTDSGRFRRRPLQLHLLDQPRRPPGRRHRRREPGQDPRTLGVHASDGYTTDNGQLDLLAKDKKSVGIGAWVHAARATVTIAPGATVEGPLRGERPQQRPRPATTWAAS